MFIIENINHIDSMREHYEHDLFMLTIHLDFMSRRCANKCFRSQLISSCSVRRILMVDNLDKKSRRERLNSIGTNQQKIRYVQPNPDDLYFVHCLNINGTILICICSLNVHIPCLTCSQFHMHRHKPIENPMMSSMVFHLDMNINVNDYC
jgi:hypothetical protein